MNAPDVRGVVPADATVWVISQYAKQVELDEPEFVEDDFYDTLIAKVTI